MQEETGNGEGLGIFRKMCVGGFMNQDVGETQIASHGMHFYVRAHGASEEIRADSVSPDRTKWDVCD